MTPCFMRPRLKSYSAFVATQDLFPGKFASCAKARLSPPIDGRVLARGRRDDARQNAVDGARDASDGGGLMAVTTVRLRGEIMRPTVRPMSSLLPLALLLTATSALGQDLTGYYRVTGDLPGPGGEYEGVAALSPSGSSSYRVRVMARTTAGHGLRLSGVGRLIAGRLDVRYQALNNSLVGALGGNGPTLTGLVGRYRVGADGAIGGRVTATGVTPAGQARYVRTALPALVFAPEALQVAPGATATTELRGASDVLSLVSVRGPGKVRLTGTGAARRVTVTGLPAGVHELTAHLGTTRGAVLARLAVTVGAPSRIVDVVAGEVERAVADGQSPVVIFDLDDTLFETRTRSAAIIREFGAQNGDARLEAAHHDHVRFGLEDTLSEVGLTQAEIAGALGRAVRRFWSPRFFNGTHYHHDTALAGSVAYVNRLHGLGAQIVYLTGRKTAARAPSLEALRVAGFPTGDRTTIFVKPDAVPGQPKLETAEWKGLTTRTAIAAMGPVVAAFDNEPVNCNALRENLPATTRVIFLDTLWKPDSPALLATIVTIRDYVE